MLDDNIELMSDEEKIIRNTTILADAAFETSREKMEEWKITSTVDLSFHEILRDEITTSL